MKLLRRWRKTSYVLIAFLLLQVYFYNIATYSDDHKHDIKDNFMEKQKIVYESKLGKIEVVENQLGNPYKEVQKQEDNLNEKNYNNDLQLARINTHKKDNANENMFIVKKSFQPSCEITISEAKSAVQRAKTDACKQQIADVACKIQNQTLLDNNIPRLCDTSIERLKYKSAPKQQYYGEHVKPVRIMYMLVVHGRAFRQFKRLFKNIYHERHYFYIHVDKRSDYLHRQISEHMLVYPNVRLTEWRLSTIWGGASLLKMILRAIKEALALWSDWDFFINLSALDFPIDTDNNLSKYLSVYQENSFFKSHGRSDDKSFIRKQGLNRVFVECDEHMYRVGSREIPSDLKVTGGSDWLALNRQFCQYSVYGLDETITKLKNWYSGYTLLPVESFFHTLAHNSEYCHLFIDNNLRVTNWNRARGCKCQYKHIVDWCGCSPNDFFPGDLKRLKTTRPVFFARKFEEVVNQQAVNLVESEVYGEYPPETPSVNCYWENTYDRLDGKYSASDAFMTSYWSFARASASWLHNKYIEMLPRKIFGKLKKSEEKLFGECQLSVNDVVSVELYKKEEHFVGYVLTLETGWTFGSEVITIQSLIKPRPLLSIIDPNSPLSKRLISANVGHNWDVKELLLRDWGGIVAARGADPRIVVHWRKEEGEVSVTAVIIDPYNSVVDRTEFKTPKSSAGVTETHPTLKKPLTPGTWKVMFFDGNDLSSVAVELKFIVVPLEVYEGKAENPKLKEVNLGYDYNKHEPDESLQDVANKLKLVRDEKKLNQVSEQSSNIGGNLLQSWIDQVVRDKWNAEDVCILNSEKRKWLKMLPSSCTSFMSVPPSICENVEWSTFYPDPKSSIGSVNENGRLR